MAVHPNDEDVVPLQTFRLMVDNIPNLAWVARRDGSIYWYNKRWYEYTGTTPEAMMGWEWQSVHDPAVLPIVVERWRASIDTGQPFEMVFPLRGADGLFRPFLTRVIPLRDEAGEILQWFGTNTDIGDERRAEDALRESQNRLAAIFEAVMDGISVFDRDGNLIFLNKAQAAINGYENEEELKKNLSYFASVYELSYPDGTPCPVEEWPISRVYRGERFNDLRLRARRKDIGREWFFSFSGSGTTDERGELQLAVVATKDITSEQSAQQTLRKQRELTDLITGNATTGLFIMDDRQHCTFMNPAAERITGISLEEVLRADRPLHELIHHTRPDGTRYPMRECPIDRALPEQANTEGEDVFVRPDGSFYPVAFSASPIVENGRPIGTVIELRDTTEEKRREQEIEELLRKEKGYREQAERANALKDMFLATLSHELRTPLTSVIGFLELATFPNTTRADVDHAIASARSSAAALRSIVEDLLDVQRIVTGKLALQLRPALVSSVVTRAVEIIRPAVEAKGIVLKTSIAPLPTPMLFDEDRLQQLLGNLLSNALKFTPRGGVIAVELEREAEMTVISVSDTGVGIAPDFLPHIFERFRQEDSSFTREYGGLGLGLSIVKQFAELHGGTVDAVSDGKHEGSTFTVRLPLVSADGEDAAAIDVKTLPDHSLDGLELLAVDDDDAVLTILTTTLQRFGARVVAARSGAEAIRTFEENRPDLLILDIGLPHMNGYELLRRIREVADGGSVPAIALTAYARNEDRQKALDAGFQEHLTKPIEFAVLLRAICALAGDAAAG